MRNDMNNPSGERGYFQQQSFNQMNMESDSSLNKGSLLKNIVQNTLIKNNKDLTSIFSEANENVTTFAPNSLNTITEPIKEESTKDIFTSIVEGSNYYYHKDYSEIIEFFKSINYKPEQKPYFLFPKEDSKSLSCRKKESNILKVLILELYNKHSEEDRKTKPHGKIESICDNIYDIPKKYYDEFVSNLIVSVHPFNLLRKKRPKFTEIDCINPEDLVILIEFAGVIMEIKSKEEIEKEDLPGFDKLDLERAELYVKFREGSKEFLQNLMKEKFKIIIFSILRRDVLLSALEVLGITSDCFSAILSKEDCVEIEQVYFKIMKFRNRAHKELKNIICIGSNILQFLYYLKKIYLIPKFEIEEPNDNLLKILFYTIKKFKLDSGNRLVYEKISEKFVLKEIFKIVKTVVNARLLSK